MGNAGTPLHIAGDIPVSSTWALDAVIDDVGLWNNVLSAGEAGALYSLANTVALNYHLGYAQQVFDVHAGGGGVTTVPEPSMIVLLAIIGLMGVWRLRR